MNRPFRIGIACYPTYGGSGIVATELGLALAQRGHEVHFLAYDEPPRLAGATNVHVHLVKVAAYPLFKYPPYDLALASKMLDLLRWRNLDVIHAHYAIPHALCAYLARQMAPESQARIVTTLHGTDITVVGSDESYHEVTRFGILHSDEVLAVSAYLAAETRRIFAIDRPLVVAHNFVDSDRFRPARERAPGPPTLVHVSNFRPVKRPQDVVEAFARIRARTDARLRLVGDGPELAACLERARALGLAEHVEALGPRSDVETVLAASDLLLQPSGTEAFGLAALEAMACGVPVVGYRVGGLPEVVTDGADGYLVPFSDVEALAARSLELLHDPARRRAFGERARERARTDFSVEKSVRLHEQVYGDCIRRPCEKS